MRRGEGLVGVLRRLWEYWLRLKFQLSCLYLDRGFCAGAVLRWLLKQELPFVMAAPKKGKQGGIKGPGVWPYTVRSPKDGSVTVQVAVVGKYLSGRWGKQGRGEREVWEKGLPFRRLLFFLAWAIERRLGAGEALFMPIKPA